MGDDHAPEDSGKDKREADELVEFTFDSSDAGTAVPEPKRKRKASGVDKAPLLKELPLAHMYEKSFMHKDIVTHVATTPNDFILTASADGDLRFWKKTPEDCTFVKRYRSHKEAVTALVVSDAGELCATMCHDGTVKVYDVASFDMIVMLRLGFVPGCAAFISRHGAAQTKLAVSELESPRIWVYDVASGSDEPVATLETVHQAPVTCMAANMEEGTVISADSKGFIKYWRADTYEFPVERVAFKSLLHTDLMECVKVACIPKCIAVARGGALFSVTCSDLAVRVFAFASGKCKRRFREAIKDNEDALTADADSVEIARRRDQEKQLCEAFTGCARGPVAAPWFNAVFDESGAFLLFPSWKGIKIVCLADSKVEHVLGEVELERYTQVALYQGAPRGKKKARTDFAMGQAVSNEPVPDPTLVAAALGQHRFYLYSGREPEDVDDPMMGRDVFNEKPTEDEVVGGPGASAPVRALPSGVIIHTTVGDITLRLFPEECPRTIENFTTHARNGYYDGLIFHRVIEKFMVQTGDPLGDGTGGESIWGGEFEDEIVPSLRHDRPGVMSMANSGPNTNGSQFFITTVPTPWLDGKHTVFGRVVRGMDTVSIIEKVKVDKKTDKPWEDIRMVSLTLLDKPPV